MKESVLITGASGFIGFHLVEAALRSGLSVYAGVRKGSDVSHLVGYNIGFCELDYGNKEQLKKQLAAAGCNYIVHAAGATRAHSQQAYDTINAEYSVNLATAAMEVYGDQLRRFVFVSSLAALGPLNNADVQITEEVIPAPVTAYGRSKLLAEEKLKALSSLPLVILRPTAVYGPRERDIFIMLRSVSKGVEAYIGRGQQQLSFVYVKDFASVVIKALFASPANLTFNISDGRSYDQYQLANLSKEILQRKTIRLHLPYSLIKGVAFAMEKLYGWRGKTPVLNIEKLNELTAVNWQCSIEKAKAQLGFNPQYDLGQGLRETLQWYHQNKWL
jgi:nucleoside-diphosphate-sugar epimerase